MKRLVIHPVDHTTAFASALYEGCLLHEIPDRMLALDETQSELTNFNYGNIFYL